MDGLSVYDEEVGETLSIMHTEQEHLPLILVGHSADGLIVTLWAHRHPGVVAGLILSPPRLEMYTMANLHPVAQLILRRVASRNPKWGVPSGGGLDFYDRSPLYGHQAPGLPVLEGISEDDPAVTGWGCVRAWKRPESCPIPAAWLDTIMAGHETIEKDVHLTCPALPITLATSYFESEWCERVFTSGIVLDVEIIRERSSRLADQVTIARFLGKHNLFLLDSDVHEKVYDTMK